MSPREEILQRALELPPEDRAYVAIALEHSLPANGAGSSEEDDQHGISSEEFLVELQRRSAAYRAGTTTARSVADVLSDMRARQSGTTTP